MDIVISLVIGIPFGIISSLIAWWILFHVIIPKIEFSENISKLTTEDSGSKCMYRLKILNSGKRSMIDMEVIVRYRAKAINLDFSNNWRWETLAIDNDRIPLLQKDSNRIFRIYPEKTECFKYKPYSEDIRLKAHEGILTLEDILSLGEQSHIRLYIFGYDQFSGTRRLFQSKFYGIEDVKQGRFIASGLSINEKK